uniref:PHD-type zinc finger plants domain-containing protein n=1 Tax=Aegilops tauschii TaxID=37682 RepID=M8BE38_AEGTA
MEPPPSPLGTGAGAVCCMCGDRGLPHELLRCKLCRVRLQHRYCSDLYPRATAYRRCNWCLREPAEAHAQPHAHPVASKKADKRKMVSKPVKEPKVDEKPALPLSLGMVAKGNNNDEKPMQARKLARLGRVKVRRCKLLAGVRIKGRAPTPDRFRAPTPECIRAPTPDYVQAPTPDYIRGVIDHLGSKKLKEFSRS